MSYIQNSVGVEIFCSNIPVQDPGKIAQGSDNSNGSCGSEIDQPSCLAYCRLYLIPNILGRKNLIIFESFPEQEIYICPALIHWQFSFSNRCKILLFAEGLSWPWQGSI